MFKLSFAFLLCLYYTLYQQNFLLHMQLFPSERSKCSKTRRQPRYGVYIFFLYKRTIFEVYKRCWSTKRKKLSDDIEQCAKWIIPKKALLRALRGIRSFAHAYFLPISFFPFCDQYLYNTANAFFCTKKEKTEVFMNTKLSLFDGITPDEYNRMMVCFQASEKSFSTDETVCFYADHPDYLPESP